jgi:hypothetical protein
LIDNKHSKNIKYQVHTSMDETKFKQTTLSLKLQSERSTH